MRLLRKPKYWAKRIVRRPGEGQQRQASQTNGTRVASSSSSVPNKSDRDSDRISKDESSYQNRSLWNHAYEALRIDNPKLVAEYESLLKRETQTMGLPLTEGTLNHNTRGEGEAHDSHRQFSPIELEHMLSTGSTRLEEQQMKIIVGSHELVVEEGVAKAANFALWVKDLVSKAVSASPEASLAWAGVCLVLPLLTNPQTAKEAQRDGFDFATEKMHYYTALEPIIRRFDEDSEEDCALAKIENSIEKLYQHILDFQIKSVLRFYQGSLSRYWQDVISSTSWMEMKKRIQDLANIVDGELSLIHGLMASSELKSLNKTSQQSFESLQKLSLISQQQLDATQDLVSLQKDAATRALSKEEERVKHLFQLLSDSQKATYEWYKSRVEDSVQGTCQWFLSQEGYTKWLAQESGTLLVTADPGCGKSVLSKHLIDYRLQSATVYFFFKDREQNTVRQALCALLHQLFIKKPFLIKHAMGEYSNSGDNVINNTISLWRIFDNIVRDAGAGSVTIVLDALDECAEPELRDLTKGLIQHLKTKSPNGPQSGCKLKVLLSSRPYKRIKTQLQKLLDDFTSVHIPGEQYSEAIGKEVNLVIKTRIEQLQLTEKLQEPEKLRLKKRLTDRLCHMPNRTYLWVHVVFEQLENEGLDHETEKGVDSFFKIPPKDLSETYTRILQKCTDPEKTRMAFAIMLAARRLLDIPEFNLLMNIRNDQRKFEDLDLEPDEVFASKLPSWCGLLISVHHWRVDFLHQTAREFLLESSSSRESLPKSSSSIDVQPEQAWYQSISLRDAHTVLAEQCLFCLNLWKTQDPTQVNDKSSLCEYAAENWASHIQMANLDQNSPLIPFIIDFCQPGSTNFFLWSYPYDEWGDRDSYPKTRLVICVASYYGLRAVVEKLWTTGNAEIDSKDDGGRTPLYYAADGGEVAMVRWLLETGKVDVNSEDVRGYTPLLVAASSGHPAVFNLLLETGKVDVNSKNRYGETPLILAAECGSEAIVRLLLETHQADINIKDSFGLTALDMANVHGHHAIAEVLETMSMDLN